ncbi:ABC transporter ATP-binding protein [Nocardioides phosphati]|uniref:ABC transporter ATP-binding protein n=1 Tax=Nocardioides phosphati TaxID=1867775 RepID=A0ABQ2N7K5_9ACTN|nr:ABC transporter ATP-binding protein [Nocardioides phosphati]GGO86185.1 ABC transporter ATP-binding protein [Nocardioides phosphati]
MARGLRRTYRAPDGSEIRALDDVDLDVQRGELTVIAGPSGSGKSTLLQVLAGLDRPDSGSVHIGGQDITRGGDRTLSRMRRRRLGFVFQSFNLIDSLTARENIALPMQLDGRKVDEARMQSLADSLGLGERLDHYPTQLSGGQQQRIAVVRALVSDPEVVFADEPTASLDTQSGEQMIATLLEVAHHHGHAVVAISHDPKVEQAGDKVYRMAAGQLTLVRSNEAARTDFSPAAPWAGQH